MATFKKGDFIKLVNESPIDEFVDSDGSIISGDEKYNKGVDVKTGPINMPGDDKGMALDTDTFAAQAIQPKNWWWSLTHGFGQGRGHAHVGSNLEHSFSESISETELTSEQRMAKMVEDILSRQSNDNGLVKRTSGNEVNRGEIPNIETISDTKMIVVGKLNDLLKSVTDDNLSGEELGIVINALLDKVDTNQIPSDYRMMLKKKL